MLLRPNKAIPDFTRPSGCVQVGIERSKTLTCWPDCGHYNGQSFGGDAGTVHFRYFFCYLRCCASAVCQSSMIQQNVETVHTSVCTTDCYKADRQTDRQESFRVLSK